MAALCISETDVEAYEECRLIFCAKAGGFCGRGTSVTGIPVLLKEGMFAWMQYRNTGQAAPAPVGLPLRRPEAGRLTDELVLLLATLMGGDIYEPEF